MKFHDRLEGIRHARLPVKIAIACVFAVLGIAALAGLAFLGGMLLQWLWNATITAIFGTPPITWWQAVLLLVLCKILFGNEYKVHMHGRDRQRHGEH